ncbi:MAG: tunicamycin resistance protein [Firmicutes bacterium]|nr:tunicamycin resistance protein [Bacillota bacterium]
MIIWINGSFGSGKTSISNQLNKRLKNSYIYDPEEVGFFIRNNIPSTLKNYDFQDFHLWREFNYKMLSYIESNYKGIIIVPMTIIKKQYFDEIIGRLVSDGILVKHFTLLASKDTLIDRLTSRGDGKNSWVIARVDKCIEALNDEYFKEHIITDEKTAEEVTAIIIKMID